METSHLINTTVILVWWLKPVLLDGSYRVFIFVTKRVQKGFVTRIPIHILGTDSDFWQFTGIHFHGLGLWLCHHDFYQQSSNVKLCLLVTRNCHFAWCQNPFFECTILDENGTEAVWLLQERISQEENDRKTDVD